MIENKDQFASWCDDQGVRLSGKELLAAHRTEEWIALVTHELSSTGAPLALLHMAEEFQKLGRFSVIFSPKDGALREIFEKSGFPVVVDNQLYRGNLVDECAHLFSLVLVNTIAGAPLIRKLNYSRCPVVWWVHESKYQYDPIFAEQLPERLGENIRVYCVSEIAEKALRNHRPSYKISSLCPFSEDMRLSKASCAQGNIIPQGKLIFLNVATLCKIKGQSIGLRAIDFLKSEIREKCCFVFVGVAVEKEIKEQIDRYQKKYPGQVLYLGEVSHNEMAALYSRADCCLCTSRSDSLNLTIVEAMSLSKQIICSENAGVSPYLLKENAGQVYENNDSKALAACITRVVENDLGQREMPANARKVYERFFSEKVFRGELEKLLKKEERPTATLKKYPLDEKYHQLKSSEEVEFVVRLQGTEGRESTLRALKAQTHANWRLVKEGEKNSPQGYTCFIESGIKPVPEALERLASRIFADSPDFIYADEIYSEDIENKSGYKPDFALYTLLSGNYIGGFFTCRNTLWEHVGLGESCGSYEAVLRLTMAADSIIHLPESLADCPSKSYDETRILREQKELKEFLREQGRQVDVEPIAGSQAKFRLRYPIEGQPLISIIICSRDNVDDLKKCIESIREKSSYTNYEIIIVDNGSTKKEVYSYYDSLRSEGVQTVFLKIPFNFAKMNNYASTFAKGKYFLFLNNDTEILSPGWMEELLMLCQQKDVGIVGAKLYYPDGTLQHGGMAADNGLQHIYMGFDGDEKGYADRLICVQNCCSVTGACLMISAALYEDLGGMNEKLLADYNDTELCFEALKRGKAVLYTPFAELTHYESKTRGYSWKDPRKETLSMKATEYMKRKWPRYFGKGDPYFNPRLCIKDFVRLPWIDE